MENEIVKAQELGISSTQEEELLADLPQIRNERQVLTDQYNEVIQLDIEDPETAKRAKSVRLSIRDNRTKGINVWHSKAKEFFLRGGQFVDAIRRKEIAINERMEENLLQIEKHAEIQEKKRIEALKKERVERLKPYYPEAETLDIGNMPDDVFESYFDTKKSEFLAQKEAEKKAEEERKIKAQKEYLFRSRKDEILLLGNPEFLIQLNLDTTREEFKELIAQAKADKQKREAEAEAQRLENERLKREAKAKEEEERRKREELQAKVDAERKEREKIEREEREKREALEAELKQKKEAEAKKLQEEEEKRQAELAKGDSEKVDDLIDDLVKLKSKYSFESENAKAVYSTVISQLDKIVDFIERKTQH